MTPVNRRVLLTGGAALLGSAALPACTPPSPAQEALRRGVAWLLTQQDPGGAFPSRTFGFMAAGHSLTPLALLALSEPGIEAPREALTRGVGALLALGGGPGAGATADYPVYAAAMTLSALARLHPEGPPPKAVSWIQSQQLQGGFEGHPGHGGFPMGGPRPPEPGRPLHVDLSMTRRAIEALVAVGADPGPAEGFVLRCNMADGGFIYSPVEAALNKGGCDATGCASYGSATCDGVLALLALDPSHPRIGPALERLRARHVLDRNPGVSEAMGDFAVAMRFYYRAGAAQVFDRLGGPPGWRADLAAALVAEQQPDGRWQNESPLQKESDPIVATSLALTALSRCLKG